jgi:hypothetical protein
MQAQTSKVTIRLLIEGGQGDNNFTAYIPELRLGAVGDTIVEARENAIDLAKMEMVQLRNKLDLNNVCLIETVDIELDDNIKVAG